MASSNWKGVVFVFVTISHTRFLRKVLSVNFLLCNSIWHLFFSFVFQVPSKEQVDALSKELRDRATVPGLKLMFLYYLVGELFNGGIVSLTYFLLQLVLLNVFDSFLVNMRVFSVYLII